MGFLGISGRLRTHYWDNTRGYIWVMLGLYRDYFGRMEHKTDQLCRVKLGFEIQGLGIGSTDALEVLLPPPPTQQETQPGSPCFNSCRTFLRGRLGFRLKYLGFRVQKCAFLTTAQMASECPRYGQFRTNNASPATHGALRERNKPKSRAVQGSGCTWRPMGLSNYL